LGNIQGYGQEKELLLSAFRKIDLQFWAVLASVRGIEYTPEITCSEENSDHYFQLELDNNNKGRKK
jgi:hypothetical protein